MSQLEQATPDNALPLGLGLIGLVLVGSLWGCLGFISEWAGIEAGLPEGLAHGLFRGIGFGTAGLTCALSSWAVYRIPSWRRQAAIGLVVYLFLLWLTPRSFTYDTGLYHLPLINHLNQIGLEWNLGWLHTRYAFFNLLLYGQSALSRLAGTVSLPSLNGLVVTGTIIFLLETLKNEYRTLIASILVTGAILLPSESTESFHSFNADFSLGCIFLVGCLLVTAKDQKQSRQKTAIICLGAFLPLIKVSGLFLIPVIASGYLRRWGAKSLAKNCRRLIPLLAILVIILSTFGYVTSGYLSYPVAGSGPLRDNSISKTQTITESRLNTLAWARFAYSGQIKSMSADASLRDWFPKWLVSLNGKRMTTYAILSVLAWLRLKKARDAEEWQLMLATNTLLWPVWIFLLPPDPRFYWGPTLLTLYALGLSFLTRTTARLNSCKSRKSFISSILCICLFTSAWRSSELTRFSYPESAGIVSEFGNKPYRSRSSNSVIRPVNGACWTIRPPCSPQ